MPDPNKDDLNQMHETPPYSERDGAIGYQIAACIIAVVVILALASLGVQA